MKIMKGDIYLVEIPAGQGHEQSGLRPVIVLSDINAGIVSIIPFTSNFHSLKYSYTIKIGSSESNGLKADSVALVFQLRAIDRKRLKIKIGMVESEIMEEIDNLIKKLFSLKCIN